MLSSAYNPFQLPTDDAADGSRKRLVRQNNIFKRSQSACPSTMRGKVQLQMKKSPPIKRYRSLSPNIRSRKPEDKMVELGELSCLTNTTNTTQEQEKDLGMPQCLLTKTMRTLATKKREFMKLRKSLISQQNLLLESYASIRELEKRIGGIDDGLGDIRILSVTSWPPHDLLLLVRNESTPQIHADMGTGLGVQVLQQMQDQFNLIYEEVLTTNGEILERRNAILNLMRTKHRADRSTYLSNLEWKNKNIDLDEETEKLNTMSNRLAESLKHKIIKMLNLAKVPWIDRETLMKKAERLQNDNIILQQKVEEMSKKCDESNKEIGEDNSPSNKALSEELTKERAAREALKEVLSAAESMLRVARARIATLERQLKETRAELEAAQRKHKELEQLYRHREMSYDARSKKFLQVSKSGELTIETLSRQRDALENRVKELREQAEAAEKAAADREAEQRSRIDTLQSKVAAQEQAKTEAKSQIIELESRNKVLENQLHNLQERCDRLIDLEKQHCLDYLPTKEIEPSDKEIEIWKELQVTRAALSRTEEELRESRADKDNLLNSLSRIAQEEGGGKEDKLATELLDREQKISKLQRIIEEQRENEKIMEQSMTNYQNQLVSLRLELKRLRNYDCYSRDIPCQDLQTELLEMQMQVETLTRERASLVSAAASRALMLERHERAAELFACITRARQELVEELNGHNLQQSGTGDESEISRTLSPVCENAASTWSALQTERARVIQLESAVLAQSLQLEREGFVRTQLERRRAILEREVLRAHQMSPAELSMMKPEKSSYLKDP